jgi:hypothetical protein
MDRLNSNFFRPSHTAAEESLVTARTLWLSIYELALADLVCLLVHMAIRQAQGPSAETILQHTSILDVTGPNCSICSSVEDDGRFSGILLRVMSRL